MDERRPTHYQYHHQAGHLDVVLLIVGGLICTAIVIACLSIAANWETSSGAAARWRFVAAAAGAVALYLGRCAYIVDRRLNVEHTNAAMLTFWEAERRRHEARRAQHLSDQEERRLWQIEDELGIDLDGDGQVGEPETKGLIARLIERMFSGRDPEEPRWPRTRFYSPPVQILEGQTRVHTVPQKRAAATLAQFIKDSWMLSVGESKDPLQEAPGLTRRAWGIQDAGEDDLRRKLHEACITALIELGIIRKEGKAVGFFLQDLNASLIALNENIAYVNIPPILAKSEPRPIQAIAAKPANEAKAVE